jgi:anti-sigma factor RsiW
MSRCWQEGAWRAYIDGELPAEEMAEGLDHLSQCAGCSALYEEIAARAGRVGAMMAGLELMTPEPPRRRVAAGLSWKWAAGMAAAAAVAAAFALSPKRVIVVEAPSPAAQVLPERPAPVQTPVAMPATPTVAVTVPRVVRTARRKAALPQYFIPLDEEPIDTGTVMRVTLESGMQADLIVDTGGRPRAIRPVSAIR